MNSHRRMQALGEARAVELKSHHEHVQNHAQLRDRLDRLRHARVGIARGGRNQHVHRLRRERAQQRWTQHDARQDFADHGRLADAAQDPAEHRAQRHDSGERGRDVEDDIGLARAGFREGRLPAGGGGGRGIFRRRSFNEEVLSSRRTRASRTVTRPVPGRRYARCRDQFNSGLLQSRIRYLPAPPDMLPSWTVILPVRSPLLSAAHSILSALPPRGLMPPCMPSTAIRN